MSSAASNLRAEAPAAAAGAAELETPLPCPLCGYDLRGLPEERCPECGHAFSLLELRRAQRRAAARPMPWLVEYPPDVFYGTARNALLTQLLTVNPWWFWRRLRPTMRINQSLLRGYAGFGWVFTAAGLFLAIALEPYILALPKLAYHYLTFQTTAAPSATASAWGTAWDLSERQVASILPLVLICLWPWLTRGILSCFRMSLRQARVRPGHLLRCVTYSADMAIPISITLLASSGLIEWWIPDGWRRVSLESFFSSFGLLGWFGWFTYSNEVPSPLAITAAVVLIWFAVRLSIAYRRYLAFPHAIATVISSQIILWLAFVTLWVQSLMLTL